MSSVGGMKGRGARFLAQVGSGLEHRHRMPCAHQIGGGDEADRPGAGDQNAVFNGHAGSIAVPCSMILARMRATLLNLRDARFGDDVTPLGDFGGDELSDLVG